MAKYRIDLDCNKIADLYLSGETAKEIGKIFGVSPDPILLRLRESGIQIRRGHGIKDITGKRFGRLVAIQPEEKRKHSYAVWVCKCDCGNLTSVTSGNLSSGNTRSCGCYHAEKVAKMLSERRGPKNHMWDSSRTDEERKRERKYPEYKEWRTAVFERDNYICQKCGEKGKRLNAHHIESYDINKDLRTALENGVTLCVDCHDDFHHIYGNGNNTREQFERFCGGEGVV